MYSLFFLLTLIVIIGILAICSYTDLKTKTIPVYLVGLLYVFVFLNLFLSGKDKGEASICFCFTLIMFLMVHIISRKQFGMGDVLVIAALGWLIGSSEALKIFLINMGLFSIPYTVVLYLYHRNRYSFNDDRSIYPYIPVVFFTTVIFFAYPDLFIY